MRVGVGGDLGVIGALLGGCWEADMVMVTNGKMEMDMIFGR